MARDSSTVAVDDIVEELGDDPIPEEIPNFSVDEPEEEEPKGKEPKDDEQEEVEEEEEFEEELAPSAEEEDKELTMRDRVFRERRVSAEKQAEIEERVYQAETAALKAELRGVSGDIRGYEADLASFRRDLAEAQEKGDSNAVSDLTDKLTNVRVSMLDAQRTKKELESKVGEREKFAFNPAEQAFLKLNPWFNDKDRYRGSKYDKIRSSTIQIDRQLSSERLLDPKSHDYFRELDLRLRKKHPDVFGKRAEKPQRSTVGGVRSSPGTGKASGNSAGKDLARKMEALGMDPRDPRQVAAWRNAERKMGN